MKHSLSTCLLTLLFVFLCGSGPAHSAEKVVLQLRWDHQFQFAGYYAALWQGFYADEGLDVELRSGVTPEKEILSGEEEIAAGRADFGIGSADILLARDRGQPLVVCATIFQRSATEFYALKELGIRTPADLVGRKVARVEGGLIDVELKAMLLYEGIDPSSVPPYPQRPGLEELLAGAVVAGYSIEMPYHASTLGLKLSHLRPADYGVDFYGDSLFTSAKMVKNHPDRVARFVTASLRGWEYALSNPVAIADRIAATFRPVYPIEDLREFNRFQIEPVKELTLYPVVRLGHTNPYRWARMYETLREMGMVRGVFDPEEFIFDLEKLKTQMALQSSRRFRWLLWAAMLMGGGGLAFLARMAVRQTFLARKERELRAIFNAVPEGLFLFERDGTLTFANEVGETMFGSQEISFRGKEVFPLPLEKVSLQEKQGPLQWCLTRPSDGHVFEAEAYLNPIQLKSRAAILVVLRDITAKKATEKVLREKERLLAVLFDEVIQFIAVLNPEGKILRVNRSAADFIHMDPKSLLGRTFWDTPWWSHNRAQQDLLRQAIKRAAAGEFSRFETSHISPDGTVLDIDFSLKPVKNERGKVVFLIPEGRDITERRKMEQAIRQSEGRLRAIFDNVAAGIAVFSPQGEYLEGNKRWAQMLGFSPQEIVGLTFPEVTYDEDIAMSRRKFNELVAGENSHYRLEKRYRRKDGTIFWADLSVTRIEGTNGEVEALIGVFIDITAQKNVEEDLRSANDELEGFVYTVSHDLRTPLTVIMGFVDILRERCEKRLNEEELSYLNQINSSSEKMIALMEDLLILAKVGQVERPAEAVDLAAVVTEVVAALTEQLSRNGLTVDIGALPLVRLPQTLLVQIFDNLIGNAIRYAGRGGGPIEVGGERRGKFIRFHVRDHGPGIDVKERTRIFETFYRGATSKRTQGTGVGLATVQKIARIYGGRAWVEETEGGGSTFCVEVVDEATESPPTS